MIYDDNSGAKQNLDSRISTSHPKHAYIPEPLKRFHSELAKLTATDQERHLTKIDGIDFTSNDFLGFSHHPAIREAVLKALHDGIPLGAGGSRLLRGNHTAHADLEDFAAKFFRSNKALFFANGYSANFAILSTLPKRQDLIVFDALCHASIREGAFSSVAKTIKTPHNDIDAIARVLSKWHLTRKTSESTAWVVVESLYSMDGDIAPLEELLQVARSHDAMLVVDEAHATGVFGQNGHGLTESLEGIPNLIVVHTCGKALGVAGALVCASDTVIDYLVNRARPFIYSTAPPPVNAVAVRTALEILGAEQHRRDHLHRLIKLANQTMEDVLQTSGSGSQIIPFIIGDNQRTLDVAQAMQNAGFDVRAIRPPSVPEGTARLRISITYNLEESQILNFFHVLKEILSTS